MTRNYEFAQVVFDVSTAHSYFHDASCAYLSNEISECHIDVTSNDIEYERQAFLTSEDSKTFVFSSSVLEHQAVLRKVSATLVDHDAFLFHASAIDVDGEGYLFTAKSGTGKSTHASFWKSHFGERCMYVNDDKPFLRYKEGSVYVYGSPWNGKHKLGNNVRSKVKAICILERGKENTATLKDPSDAIPKLLQQTYRPNDAQKYLKTLDMLNSVVDTVPIFDITCNLSESAGLEIYSAVNNILDQRGAIR